MLRSMILACGLAAPALAQSAEFIALPSGFQPVNISDDGWVVVGKLTSNTYPAMWTSAGGVRQLMGPSGEALRGTAWSASADGSVIVGTMSYNGQVPFRWTAATGTMPLTTERFFSAGNGYAVSDDGAVAAGDGSVGVNAAGFTWDAGHGLRNLDAPPGYHGGVVSAVSGDGRFASGWVAEGGEGAFVRWDLGTMEAETLTLHDGSGQALLGTVWDTNYAGDIVVGRAIGPVGGLRPVIWTSNGLEFIGSENGTARRVTADGLAVVGSTLPMGGAAWIWTEGLGVVDLKVYLRDFHGLTLPANVSLAQVYGISADGRTMCGLGSPTNWVVRLPAARPADFNRDEFVDFVDLADYLNCFDGHHLLPATSADLNHDGMTDFFDLIEFLDDFER